MSDKVSLHGAINAALAPRRAAAVKSPKTSVAGLKTNHEAEKVIRDAFRGMGLDNGGASMILRQKTLARGQLLGKPFGAVSGETRRLAKLVLGLRGNPHATNPQKLRFAARYTGIKPGRGARAVLEGLAKKPAFWKGLSSKHRDVIFYHLKRSPNAAASQKLGKAFHKLLGHDRFTHASGQGKKNALSQPHRAHRLITSYDRSKVRLPTDTAKANRDLRTYARRFSGLKLPQKQRSLHHSMVDVRKRVLSRFFENVPTYKQVAGRSVWFGENYQKHSTFTWEQTLEEYVNDLQRQQRCGAIGGGRKRCLD